MGNNMKDNVDQRMTFWLSSVSQGCSKETRFSLLSSALDAFLERFEQENGPISAIDSGYDNPPDTDVQSRDPESGTEETTSSTMRDEAVSDTDAAQPHIAEVMESSMAVSESEPSLFSQPSIRVPGTFSTFLSGETSEFGTDDRQQGETRLYQPSIGVPGRCTTFLPDETSEFGTDDRQQGEIRLKRKRKHHSHKHERHAVTKKARIDFNNHNSSLDTLEDLNNNCCCLNAPDQNHNNNYTSLDTRLEQFFVCPRTNCLIPKETQPTDCKTMKPAPDSAEHSSSKARHREMKARRREERARRREERARHREERARHREDKARHRCENVKPRQEKPRLRGHKKERSLLKAATIRCLVRKALETGTYCCYRRCFLARPRLYV